MAKKPAKSAIDIRHYDVIVAPHITEKSTMLSEHNAVVFKVAGDASKPQIKAAIEAIYGRSVKSVLAKAHLLGLEKSPDRLRAMGRANVIARYRSS